MAQVELTLLLTGALMNLTTGDMAAITAMMGTMTTVSGIIVRYFVKSEVRVAIDSLRLELAKERAEFLAKERTELLAARVYSKHDSS